MDRLGQIKGTDRAPVPGIQRGEHKRPLRSRGISVLAGIVPTVVVLAGCSHNQADKNQVTSHEEYGKANPATAESKHQTASVPGSGAEVKRILPAYDADKLDTNLDRIIFMDNAGRKTADETVKYMLENWQDVKEGDLPYNLVLQRNNAELTFIFIPGGTESGGGITISATPNKGELGAANITFDTNKDPNPGDGSKEALRTILENMEWKNGNPPGWYGTAQTLHSEESYHQEGLKINQQAKLVKFRSNYRYSHTNPVNGPEAYDQIKKTDEIFAETLLNLKQ